MATDDYAELHEQVRAIQAEVDALKREVARLQAMTGLSLHITEPPDMYYVTAVPFPVPYNWTTITV